MNKTNMNGLKLLSEIKFYNDYSKYNGELKRKQNWKERSEDVMNMHRYNPKFQDAFLNPEFEEMFNFAEEALKNKLVLGSQRVLQFAGEPIMKHNSRLYNCLTSYCDRVEVFQESMYWLLSGCGVGLSFVKEHVNKLPAFKRRSLGTKTFVIPDMIEGWSDAIGVLISSYVTEGATFPEYSGYEVKFDYSLIRPKGSYISGGFKAPGHGGLKLALERIENLLEKSLNNGIDNFKPIIAYDILMFAADAVLSGGVRRSATIALFSPEDEEMMNAKTGNWYMDNPQRARSNNSALLVRGKTSKELFDKLINSARQFGEPGFVFAESIEVVYNPCVEIGMIPRTVDYRSGWQGCNLCEINGGKMNNRETFLEACKAAAILGTLQAAYTDFRYVSSVSKEIFDLEALLGVSITGFMNNPKTLLDAEILKEGAELIKEVNKKVAAMIGIRPAARTTCVKPSGNASVLLETTSGIHGDHASTYFRVMQINKNEEIAKFIMEKYPDLLEESVWSATNADYALFVPIKAKEGSIFKKDLLGVKQLDMVKLVQNSWVEAGTNVDLCIQPYLRHNVSNTISVDNWDEVAQYIWDNQSWIAGISLLPHTGDKIYNQAPFTETLSPTEIISKYGDAALLVSGLIVDGLHLFDDNLWKACDYLLDREKTMPLEGTRTQVLLKKDWLKRAKKFATRFDSMEDLVYCMKDVHLFHKWMKTERVMRNINIEEILANIEPEYVDVDTLGSVACAGSNCEIISL
jgi:ribonucleoside-diphosphate reductase alpha chain